MPKLPYPITKLTIFQYLRSEEFNLVVSKSSEEKEKAERVGLLDEHYITERVTTMHIEKIWKLKIFIVDK